MIKITDKLKEMVDCCRQDITKQLNLNECNISYGVGAMAILDKVDNFIEYTRDVEIAQWLKHEEDQ